MIFEIFLVSTVVLLGLIVFIDKFFWSPRRQRSNSHIRESAIVEYSKAFFPVLLLVLVLRSFVADPWRIPSSSMMPSLEIGDYIVVVKYKYGLRLPITGAKIIPTGEPKRGDVVVFRNKALNMIMIKRIVGLPGDKIKYKDNLLYVNGKPTEVKIIGKSLDYNLKTQVSEPVTHAIEKIGDVQHDIYLRSRQIIKQYPYEDVVVPDDHYFMMGDNRNNSADSRFWGFVKDQDLIGNAVLVVASWDSQHSDIRWNRFFEFIK